MQKRVNIGADSTVITEACPSPVVMLKRFKNVDACSEKVELSFYRDNVCGQVSWYRGHRRLINHHS